MDRAGDFWKITKQYVLLRLRFITKFTFFFKGFNPPPRINRYAGKFGSGFCWVGGTGVFGGTGKFGSGANFFRGCSWLIKKISCSLRSQGSILVLLQAGLWAPWAPNIYTTAETLCHFIGREAAKQS